MNPVIEASKDVMQKIQKTANFMKSNITIKNTEIMYNTEAKGSWDEQKGKIKKRFAILTDNDLMFETGKVEEMLGRLQMKLGKTKEELRLIIAGL